MLLRNAHLCPEWLGGLEKKLRGLALHPSFRLFLTSEVSEPVTMVFRMGIPLLLIARLLAFDSDGEDYWYDAVRIVHRYRRVEFVSTAVLNRRDPREVLCPS